MGNIFLRILMIPLRLFQWPIKLIRTLFYKFFGGLTGNAVRKSGGNYVASQNSDEFVEQNRTTEEQPIPSQAAGLESLLFKQLERPRLLERSAPDLTLEEAAEEAKQAEEFYSLQFSLFPRGDFFYEEVEQEYLSQALGKQNNSTDLRFINIMNQFRCVLNDNTKRLFLFYTPILFILFMASSLFVLLQNNLPDIFNISSFISLGQNPDLVLKSLYTIGIFATASTLMLVLYHWPYKVTQQRNLLGLDNYITSKFSRVNQNFLVAKRRSLNAERDKRMNQVDELKEEAGIWTLAYNWFAMRLFLCETMVRNKIYQVRRNTMLYGVGGVVICLFILTLTSAGLLAFAGQITSIVAIKLGLLISLSLLFVFLAYSLIMGKAMPEILSVLHANEWARFNQIRLHQTITDHVGEDKLQIVTFRDRNRFE